MNNSALPHSPSKHVRPSGRPYGLGRRLSSRCRAAHREGSAREISGPVTPKLSESDLQQSA